MGRKDEDLGGQWLKMNKLRAACQSLYQSLSIFAVLPPPHPWLCCSYGFGCTCQTRSHTPLKKEKTSSIASSMHPHDTNFAASGVELQLVQNLAVNWKALTDLHRGTSVSTRYTLICKCSLILSGPIWPVFLLLPDNLK